MKKIEPIEKIISIEGEWYYKDEKLDNPNEENILESNMWIDIMERLKNWSEGE